MKNIFRRLAAVCLALLCILTVVPVPIQADGEDAEDGDSSYKRKIVAVVYDNTTSMGEARTAYAKYAMQNLIGALYDEDELYIIPMHERSGYSSYQVNLKNDRSAEYNEANRLNLFSYKEGPFGTPPSSVLTALDVLKKRGMVTLEQAAGVDENDVEYWLIIMTDGNFTNAKILNVIRQAKGYNELNVEYFAFGNDSTGVPQSALEGEMVFFSHKAVEAGISPGKDEEDIITAMQNITRELSRRYSLPADNVSISGKQVTIDLGKLGFSMSSLCVIAQNCGTTLNSVTYNGKSILPESRCEMELDDYLKANTNLKSGYTTVLRNTFSGGKVVLTYNAPVDSAQITVLAEPSMLLETYATYKGQTLSPTEIRHTVKPGETLTFNYRILDKLTRQPIDISRIFTDVKETVTYGGSTYRVGEAVQMKEGKSLANVRVSCMNGAYVLNSPFVCDIHKNPQDFAIRVDKTENFYQDDFRKTCVTLTPICDSVDSTVAKLATYGYQQPTLTVTDSFDREVKGVGTLTTTSAGKLQAVLDLSSVASPDASYKLTVSSKKVTATETDSIHASVVITPVTPTADDVSITPTAKLKSGSHTVGEAAFAISYRGKALKLSDFPTYGFGYQVQVTDAKGKQLKPDKQDTSGSTLTVTVDTAKAADFSCDVKLTVTGGNRSRTATATVNGTVRPSLLTVSGKSEPVNGNLTQGVAVFTFNSDNKPVDISVLKSLGYNYTVTITDKSGKTYQPVKTEEKGTALRVTADIESTPDKSCTVTLTLSGNGVNEKCPVTILTSFDPSKLTVTSTQSPVGDSMTVREVVYTFLYDGAPFAPDSLPSVGGSYALTLKDSSGKEVGKLTPTARSNTLCVTADTAAFDDMKCSTVLTVSGQGQTKTYPEALSASLDLSKLAVTGKASPVEGSLTEKSVAFTVTYDGKPLTAEELTALGFTCTASAVSSEGKSMTVNSAVETDRTVVTVDLAGTKDGWCDTVLALTGHGSPIEGHTAAAISFKTAAFDITLEGTVPAGAPLGLYTVNGYISIDGTPCTVDTLRSLWLSWEFTSPDAQPAGGTDTLTADLDVTGAASVNTEIRLTLHSDTKEDAGDTVATAVCALNRPSLDKGRIRLEYDVPFADTENRNISRMCCTVYLDDEVLTTERMTYLGLQPVSSGTIRATGGSIPVSGPTDDGTGQLMTSIDTTGYDAEEYDVVFSLVDTLTGDALGEASWMVTRYGFGFKHTLDDPNRDGSDVTVVMQLLKHDVALDKAGLEEYTLGFTCVDPAGMEYPFETEVQDDGRILIRVSTAEGGQSSLGTYRIVASAQDSAGKTADRYPAEWQRVPTVIELVPEQTGRTSLNRWQLSENTDEWVFSLKLEGEPYPFDGPWAAYTITFNGTDISDSARVEDGKLIVVPNASMLQTDNGLAACGDYGLRVEARSAVDNEHRAVTDSREFPISVVEASYTITELPSDDVSVERFASVFKCRENTASLLFSVSRDGDVLSLAELQELYDRGELDLSRSVWKNLLFGLFFGGSMTLEEQNGAGVVRYTVTRRWIPDILHGLRCFLTDGDKPYTLSCGDASCTANVVMNESPVWQRYIYWPIISLLVAYITVWFVGLFIRKPLPVGYFVTVSDNGAGLTVKVMSVNQKGSDYILWTFIRIIQPHKFFRSQDAVSVSNVGVEIGWSSNTPSLIIRKKEIHKAREPKSVGAYTNLTKKLISGGSYNTEKKALKEMDSNTFIGEVNFDTAAYKPDTPTGIGTSVAKCDNHDGQITVKCYGKFIATPPRGFVSFLNKIFRS